MTREDEFLKSLRATFVVEAEEHVNSIADGLLQFERAADAETKQQLVETMFRAAHSLKGAARAVSLVGIESLCQALEDVFAAWKRRELSPTTPALDVVHQALDAVSKAITDPDTASGKAFARNVHDLRNLIRTGTKVANGLELTAPPAQPPLKTIPPVHIEKTPVAETVRISVSKLDERLADAEEMLAAKLVTVQREVELRELAASFDEWRKRLTKIQPLVRTLRVSTPELVGSSGPSAPTELAELKEFFEWNHEYFQTLTTRVSALASSARQDSQLIGKLVDDLLDNSKKLLMLPVATLTPFLQKLVRDLCRDQGKEADLVIAGDDVEIDKRVLEAMKDSLTHIIRNCVDHGLETPKQREQHGKSSRATIRVTLKPFDGDKVEFNVADDGAGIDIERVKQAAINLGAITDQEANRLSADETLALVFRSEVSTSPLITQLSGRGLGLAIVREQTEKLGGEVSIESKIQVGTTIRIVLPITLRTFRGILLKAANQLFIVPTAQVRRLIRFRAEEVQTIEGREVVPVDGRAVSLVHLTGVLELQVADQNAAATAKPALLLGSSDEQIAFVVDEVIGEHELLVKSFGKPLLRVRNIAGATVLGSGQIAPILNVTDLLKSAKKTGRSPIITTSEKPEEESKSILLVEDSITSRMLLKGILEAAGYQVRTAVDGLDAFTILRTEAFDLVVSDVEMPRLNGFDLTARIRSDRKIAELPVVLVTALESREDRERGIDVGASAYLVKSSFDQSNLLEAVRRLA